MPLFNLSAFQLVILPLSLYLFFPWVSFFFSLCKIQSVCMYPLHGEVADGSMGSRKSAPVLVSSAPQSSDNWIIILPVCLLLSALPFLPSTSSDCLLKVCSVQGFNLRQILPEPSDGTICCLCSITLSSVALFMLSVMLPFFSNFWVSLEVLVLSLTYRDGNLLQQKSNPHFSPPPSFIE